MANPIVAFNDSPTGVVLASILHTLGALGFLGGLVGYLAWHRFLVHGHHHQRLLVNANSLAYTAIVANLLGGFMRTFESDHPGLEEFGSSAWVRAIAVKHLFLFLAMGCIVYLFESMAPRLLRAHRKGTLGDGAPTGHRVAVVLTAFGITTAAVLGALTLVYPPLEAQPEGPHAHAEPTVHVLNKTGTLTTSPLAPASSSEPFVLSNATTALHVAFSWTPSAFALSADIKGPSGQLVTLSSAGGAATADLVAPEAGTWSYTVRADAAANAAWTLSLGIEEAPTDDAFQSAHLTIPPGKFAELNLDVAKGDLVHWAWSTSAQVHFEPHTHFDGQEQPLDPREASSGSGHYEAARSGAYSLLWENKGTSPVTVDYRAWGDFTPLAE